MAVIRNMSMWLHGL